ncbi:hypothetical protein ES703_27098 [subsurface metagenome]
MKYRRGAIGIYSGKVDELAHNYIRPQELRFILEYGSQAKNIQYSS